MAAILLLLRVGYYTLGTISYLQKFLKGEQVDPDEKEFQAIQNELKELSLQVKGLAGEDISSGIIDYYSRFRQLAELGKYTAEDIENIKTFLSWSGSSRQNFGSMGNLLSEALFGKKPMPDFLGKPLDETIDYRIGKDSYAYQYLNSYMDGKKSLFDYGKALTELISQTMVYYTLLSRSVQIAFNALKTKYPDKSDEQLASDFNLNIQLVKGAGLSGMISDFVYNVITNSFPTPTDYYVDLYARGATLQKVIVTPSTNKVLGIPKSANEAYQKIGSGLNLGMDTDSPFRNNGNDIAWNIRQSSNSPEYLTFTVDFQSITFLMGCGPEDIRVSYLYVFPSSNKKIQTKPEALNWSIVPFIDNGNFVFLLKNAMSKEAIKAKESYSTLFANLDVNDKNQLWIAYPTFFNGMRQNE